MLWPFGPRCHAAAARVKWYRNRRPAPGALPQGEVLRLPTDTPPPYFPQNPLSPGDEKTARKLRLTFYGCALLVALAVLGAVVGVVYLVKSLLT